MRNPPQWLRVFFAVFPFISLFFLPWPMTLIAAFAAGLVFPPLAVIIGVLVDVLYHPGTGWYVGTVSGLLLCGLSYAVRYISRTRIM